MSDFYRYDLGVNLTPDQETMIESLHRLHNGPRRSGRTYTLACFFIRKALSRMGQQVKFCDHEFRGSIELKNSMERIFDEAKRNNKNLSGLKLHFQEINSDIGVLVIK